MKQYITSIALVVRDYDEAIEYYTQKIGFQLVEDSQLSPTKRWVLLSPPGAVETKILLAKAADTRQEQSVGNQAGGRVFLFLSTDNFWRDYHALQERGVDFIEKPREEPFGTVCIFQDLYGNRWDLIEYKKN